MGGIAWDSIKRVGKLRSDDELDVALEKRNWRTLVTIVDYIWAYQKEQAGTGVIASGDESYCHANHHADLSYLLIGKGNVTKHEVYCAVRDGLRVCMQGFVTRWGPMVLDGVVDCRFLNAAGVEGAPGARFKEMGVNNQPRAIYATAATAEKSLSKLNVF